MKNIRVAFKGKERENGGNCFASFPMFPMMRLPLLFLILSLILAACGGEPHRAPVVMFGADKGAGSAGMHTVFKDDTLWSISRRYHMAMPDIIYANHLQAPYMLAVGQRLRLPPPTTYRVRAGDSLYTISRTFEIDVTRLARLNDLRAPYVIAPGQTLNLPSVSTGAPKAAAGRKIVRKAPTPAQRKIAARTPRRAGSKFAWPVSGAVLSSYGPKKGGLHNDGINIKAPRGAPVRAADNGQVVYAGNELKGFGNLVLIRHADRWMTAYAHMDRLHVKRGQVIKQGTTLGTVGSTGGVDSPQLHFEVRRGIKALNPEAYLISRRR